MPTRSTKISSQRGDNGRDDNSPVDSEVYQETTAADPDCESPDTLVPVPASESEPVGAVAADDCGNDQTPHVPATPILSETDRKLATRMTKAIADQLGLSGRTRSVRV